LKSSQLDFAAGSGGGRFEDGRHLNKLDSIIGMSRPTVKLG
jgi:hypothetical protein